MKKSELEKAAWDWNDKHYGLPASLIDNPVFRDFTRDQIREYINNAFRAGAKWALEKAESEALDLIEHTRIACLNFKYGLRVEEDETETKEK